MFDQSEIELLMDALDALEKKPGRDLFNRHMADMMILPQGLRATPDEFSSKLDAVEEKNAPLKERIILIKAKLIGMKDKAIAENVFS